MGEKTPTAPAIRTQEQCRIQLFLKREILRWVLRFQALQTLKVYLDLTVLNPQEQLPKMNILQS